MRGSKLYRPTCSSPLLIPSYLSYTDVSKTHSPQQKEGKHILRPHQHLLMRKSAWDTSLPAHIHECLEVQLLDLLFAEPVANAFTLQKRLHLRTVVISMMIRQVGFWRFYDISSLDLKNIMQYISFKTYRKYV